MRLFGRKCVKVPKPPEAVVGEWHRLAAPVAGPPDA